MLERYATESTAAPGGLVGNGRAGEINTIVKVWFKFNVN